MTTREKIVLTAAVIAVALAGVVFYSNRESSPPREEGLGEVEEQNETAGWKPYRNEEYGFELRYPEQFKLECGSDEINTHPEPCLNDSYISFEEKNGSIIYELKVNSFSVEKADFFNESANSIGGRFVSAANFAGSPARLVQLNSCNKVECGPGEYAVQILHNNLIYSLFSTYSIDETTLLDGQLPKNAITPTPLTKGDTWIEPIMKIMLSTFKFTK